MGWKIRGGVGDNVWRLEVSFCFSLQGWKRWGWEIMGE